MSHALRAQLRITIPDLIQYAQNYQDSANYENSSFRYVEDIPISHEPREYLEEILYFPYEAVANLCVGYCNARGTLDDLGSAESGTSRGIGDERA